MYVWLLSIYIGLLLVYIFFIGMKILNTHFHSDPSMWIIVSNLEIF